MQPADKFLFQRRMNGAGAGDAGLALEGLADHQHGKMRLAAGCCTRMAGVLVAVIGDRQQRRLELLLQDGGDSRLAIGHRARMSGRQGDGKGPDRIARTGRDLPFPKPAIART